MTLCKFALLHKTKVTSEIKDCIRSRRQNCCCHRQNCCCRRQNCCWLVQIGTQTSLFPRPSQFWLLSACKDCILQKTKQHKTGDQEDSNKTDHYQLPGKACIQFETPMSSSYKWLEYPLRLEQHSSETAWYAGCTLADNECTDELHLLTKYSCQLLTWWKGMDQWVSSIQPHRKVKTHHFPMSGVHLCEGWE